jgi:iron complex outermembrane receptor protein
MRRLLLGTTAVLCGFSTAVSAQQNTVSSASGSQASGLETVIVTARKVAEDAQTVPIAITAFSAADLDKLQVGTVADLQFATPSFIIQPSTFRQDTLDITIRGQRNFDSPSGGGNTALDFDPSVAIYQDGIYYARTIGLTGQMYDLESVDILKGPQGTLVGRNSTGGAILATSREPTQNLEGYLRATAGDYAQYGFQGAINIPVSDELAVRGAVSFTGQKGYLANYFTDPVSGLSNSQPAMGTQKMAGRIAVKWQPDDSFSLLLRGEFSGEHDTGVSYHDLGYFVGTVAATGNKPSICNIPAACATFTDFLGHPVATYYNTVTATSVSNVNTAPAAYNSLLNSVAREQADGFWSTEQAQSNLDVGHYHTVSAVAEKKLDGDIDVKLTGGYRWFDSTGTAVSRGQPFVASVYVFNIPDYKSYQSELTVTGSGLGSALKWTGGLFFFEESDPRDGGYQNLFLPSAGSAPSAIAGKQASTTDQTRNGELNLSYAAYAQATYAVWPDTRVTIGARYTLDQRNAHLDTQKIIFPTTAALSASTLNGVYNSGTYTVDGIGYSGYTTVCSLTNAAGTSLPLSSCPTNLSKTFHKPTWTLAIDHDLFDKTLVYFTMRSGYRSGAINSGTFNPLVTVAQPEEVTDYEAGLKSDWDLMGMAVRSNIDAYLTAYHNLQSQQNLPNVTLATGPGGVGPCTQALFNANQCVTPTNVLNNVTFNVATARVTGVEWDLTALPIQALTLNFSGSYLDARYTNYAFTPPPGYLLPAGNSGNLSNTPIPAPRWQTSVTGTYDFGPQQIGEASLGDASFTAHFTWQSRYLADLALYANAAAQQTSSWALVNIEANLANIGNSGADLSLFMRNVANQQICTPEFTGVLNSVPNGSFTSPGTSGVLQCIPMAPRMSGIRLGYKF